MTDYERFHTTRSTVRAGLKSTWSAASGAWMTSGNTVGIPLPAISHSLAHRTGLLVKMPLLAPGSPRFDRTRPCRPQSPKQLETGPRSGCSTWSSNRAPSPKKISASYLNENAFARSRDLWYRNSSM